MNLVGEEARVREEGANLIPFPATGAQMEVCIARDTLAESWADASGVAEVAREEEQLWVRQVLEADCDAKSCLARRSMMSE